MRRSLLRLLFHLLENKIKYSFIIINLNMYVKY